MRSLNTRIKADFVKKETSVSGSASSVEGLASQSVSDGTSKRPKYEQRSKTEDGSKVNEIAETPKKSRPRSLTFTRSKDSNLTKKERPTSHSRVKSSDASTLANSTSLTALGATQGLPFMHRVPKPAIPEEYISYLNKVQKPQFMEIARIQKLRQLLRNETVSWVDGFVSKGGMAAVVNLFYRIIEVEWRYGLLAIL